MRAVVSAPFADPVEFARLNRASGQIGALVEFDYSDIYGTHYEEAVCMKRLSTGAISYPDAEECKNNRAKP